MNNNTFVFVIIMNRRCYCMKRILPILAIIAMIASLPVFAESKVESIQTNTVSTVEDDVFSSGESPDIKTGIRRVHHSPRTVIFYGSPPPPRTYRKFPYRDYRFNWIDCRYNPHYGCYGPTFNSGIFFRF